MLRQASSRNQRSKSFKVKHALQICLLVAICIWLLYQVKHSHEKKRAFEEQNSKMNKVTDNQADLFKFGRKDLPHIGEPFSTNEVHDKEEENEESQEEEHDTKQKEIGDEKATGAGDDEIGTLDQEKGEEEAKHGEESNEEEDKDNHAEEKDGHGEVDVFDSQEREGGTQEAREENYKRDDASSAVVHDTHETESDIGTGGTGNTDEEPVIDKADDDSGASGSKVDDTSSDGFKSEMMGGDLEKEVAEFENVTSRTSNVSQDNNDWTNGTEGASVVNVLDMVPKVNATMQADNASSNETAAGDNGAEVFNNDVVVVDPIQTDNLSSNGTAADNSSADVFNKDAEVEFTKPDNGSVSNSTTGEYSEVEQQNNLTGETVANTEKELHANTSGVSDHQTEVQNNSTLVGAGVISTLNDTASLDSDQNQNVAADNASAGQVAHTSQNVAEQAENSGTTSVVESEEHSTTSGNENGDAADGESDNSSHAVITEEEKDVRTDLSTLPEIQNKIKTTDDDALE